MFFRLSSFFIFLFLFTIGLAKETVCLNMIVKNEKEVICRCLDSVKPLIDYWVIVDTGSTDGTQAIIKEHMKDIPGELHERPWKNFGHNRNEALELAKPKADFILIIDADDYLQFPSNYKLPPLTQDAYNLWIQHGNTRHQRPQLFRSCLPWRWVGVVHEYLDCEKSCSRATLEEITLVIGSGGARSKDPAKYLKDAAVLEEAVREEPTNSRYVFYLAQSYRDAGVGEKAVEWYEKRIAMGGWDQEVFWSLLQIALIKQNLKVDPEVVLGSFLRAHHYRPFRIEPIYFLAEIYNGQNRHALAYQTLKAYLATPKIKEKDELFNLDWIHQYGLLTQLYIASYQVGQYQDALDACDTLLSVPDLTEAQKIETERFRKMALEKMKSAEERCRIIH